MKKREKKSCECGRQYESKEERCEHCEYRRNLATLERSYHAPSHLRASLVGLIYGCLVLALCIKPGIASEGTIFGKASWYSSKDACGSKTNNHPGCPTASGHSLYALEKQGVDFVAMNNIPMGSVVRVTNLNNGKSVTAKVLDRGGFKKYGRIIDLGKHSFQQIEDTSKGITVVKVEVVK
jgi:rare lipoprotein A (peptidoglycan hydrolase)